MTNETRTRLFAVLCPPGHLLHETEDGAFLLFPNEDEADSAAERANVEGHTVVAFVEEGTDDKADTEILPPRFALWSLRSGDWVSTSFATPEEAEEDRKQGRENHDPEMLMVVAMFPEQDDNRQPDNPPQGRGGQPECRREHHTNPKRGDEMMTTKHEHAAELTGQLNESDGLHESIDTTLDFLCDQADLDPADFEFAIIPKDPEKNKLLWFLDTPSDADMGDFADFAATANRSDAHTRGLTLPNDAPAVVVWSGNPNATDDELRELAELG